MTFLRYHSLTRLICIVSSFFVHIERISIFIAKPDFTGVCILLNIVVSFHGSADPGTAEMVVVPGYKTQEENFIPHTAQNMSSSWSLSHFFFVWHRKLHLHVESIMSNRFPIVYSFIFPLFCLSHLSRQTNTPLSLSNL